MQRISQSAKSKQGTFKHYPVSIQRIMPHSKHNNGTNEEREEHG